jgi:macrophage erythroblast attacher
VKVPYELLNKKFRAAQKNIDREVSRIQSAANELEKCLQRSATLNELTQALDNVADKLMLLKRKVS